MKGKLLKLIMAVALALGLGLFAPQAAQAATTITLDNLSNGNNSGYSVSTSNGSKVVKITKAGDYTLTQNNANSQVTTNVIIEATGTVNLTLDNVNMKAGSYTRASRFRPYAWYNEGTAAISIEGNTNCVMTLVGTNKVNGTSFAVPDETFNDLRQAAAIYVENTYISNRTRLASLTIKGLGSLEATGDYQAAGIGGNCNRLSGNITIESGTIVAKGGQWAPGIGDGDTFDLDIAKWNCANRAINGVARNCQPSTIEIKGGNVTAIAQRGTSAIGASDELCHDSGVTLNGEWDGMTIKLTGGTILAVGSYDNRAPQPSAGIGTGSNTVLNPANLIIKNDNNLKLLVLSCISTDDNKGIFPITVNKDSLPSMNADSNIALVNVYGINGGTTPVAADDVSVSATVDRILNETEMNASADAIAAYQTMLTNFVNAYEHDLDSVVGLAVNLPLDKTGMYVDDRGVKFYPSDISINPEEISVLENEKAVSYTANVTRDSRDTHSVATNGYSYTWQVSTDGGKNWANITSGKDGYTVTKDGATSVLSISKQGVTEEKDGNFYRCVATVQTDDYNQIITSENAKLNVAAYYDVTVNLKLGTENTALPLETLVGNGKALYLVDNTGNLTKLVGTNGTYTAESANGMEYTLKVGPDNATSASQLENFYGDIKVEVSDADVVRDLKFYSVTYTDGANGAVFADEVEYYFNSQKVTVKDTKRTREGFDFAGYTENNNTYQYGEKFTDTAGGEITKNHVLTATWNEQYALTVTINVNDEHRNTDSFPSTVKIRLVSRAEGTADDFTPTTDLTVYEVGMKKVEGQDKKYTGSMTIDNLPSGYDYGFVIVDDSDANYQEAWSFNRDTKTAQKATVNLTYTKQNENLTFKADASAISESCRPVAVNVRIMQSLDGNKWTNVLKEGDEEGARALILKDDEDGIVTATIGVPTFDLDNDGQIDITNPYYYKLEVVSYSRADGSEKTPEQLPWMTGDCSIEGGTAEKAGAYYTWSNDTTQQIGTPLVTLSGDMPDLTYQANLDDAQGVPDNKENVLKLEASDLPTITGPEGSPAVFMGWYMDKALTEKAEAGTYLTKDTTLYGKWVELQDLKGSVTVSYTHDDHEIPEDVRSKEVTVILQAAYETTPNKWGAVTSKKVALTESVDGKSASADVTFENQRETDRDGTEILYRILVTEPEYSTVYMNEKNATESVQDPTAGYYHAKLNFNPTMQTLYYQLDVSDLTDAAKEEIGTLQGVLLYSPNEDGSGGSDPYWGSSFVEYEGAETGVQLNVKNAGNYVGGNTKVWTTIHNSQSLYFQLKLVDNEGKLLEPVGYTITRSKPVSYDRDYVVDENNKGAWIGGQKYEGTGANAITLTLEPKLYNLEFNLGYEAYPNNARPTIWQESPLQNRAYGNAVSATDINNNKPPTREGYTFVEWVEVDENGRETPVKDIDALDTNGHTYLAKWKANGGTPVDPVDPIIEKVKLTYDTNGGNTIADKHVVKGTTVDLSNTLPHREGYTFTGWYADEDLTEPIEKIKMNKDKTVYAGWEKTDVPGMLNGTDHYAYVQGYPNGNVVPQGNITRAEVATIFFRLLNDDVREENLSKSNDFTDTKASAWYNTAVSTLTKMGILHGYEDGSFRPNDNITRAEFAAIAARFDKTKTTDVSSFSDISGHWAEKDIAHAATLGWVGGYPDGTFGPNKSITRAETMSLTNRVLGRLPEKESDLLSTMITWPDCASSAWYYLAVQEATNSHNYKHKADGVHESWTSLRDTPNWSKYE